MTTFQVAAGDVTTYQASPQHAAQWQEQTGTPYDPLEAAAVMMYREVECPKCFMRVSVRKPPLLVSYPGSSDHPSLAFLTPEGTGYSQHQFSAGCPSCKFTITRENLAVLKFARDAVLDPSSLADVQKY